MKNAKTRRASVISLVLAAPCLWALGCGGSDTTTTGQPNTGSTPTIPTTGTTPSGTAGAGATAAPPTTAGKAGSGATGATTTTTTPPTGSTTSPTNTTPASGNTTSPTSSAAGSGGSTTSASGSAGSSSGSAGSTSGSAGSTGSSGNPEGSGANSCLDGITDFDKAGPFKFMQKNSGAVVEIVPMVPAGCKVPMVHLANGTGATCSAYQPALERLASHGFLTLCYEDPNTGAGNQGVMAFDTALKDFPDLADMKFGSTGHSQGGQASFVVLQKAEAKWGDKGIYAGLAMEPASGFGSQPEMSWQSVYKMIKSPMFMFSGVPTDGLVSQAWVQQAFDAMSDSVEKIFWSRNGATHIPVPNGEEEQISIPWFRWKLLGDKNACMAFKNIPKMDTTWMEVAAKNEKDCN